MLFKVPESYRGVSADELEVRLAEYCDAVIDGLADVQRRHASGEDLSAYDADKVASMLSIDLDDFSLRFVETDDGLFLSVE